MNVNHIEQGKRIALFSEIQSTFNNLAFAVTQVGKEGNISLQLLKESRASLDRAIRMLEKLEGGN